MEGVSVYLACPYSDPDPEVCEARARKADRAAAYLMSMGYVVFSPITHSHRISLFLENHLDHDFWLKQDSHWIDSCDEVALLTIEGYNESKGMWWEKGYAAAAKKKVFFVHWEEVLEWEATQCDQG